MCRHHTLHASKRSFICGEMKDPENEVWASKEGRITSFLSKATIHILKLLFISNKIALAEENRTTTIMAAYAQIRKLNQ